MVGYISYINGYHYFCLDKVKPKLNSFVIQGKVKTVYFYTNQDTLPPEEWIMNCPYYRKYKKDDYTREIIFTDDPKLIDIKKLNFSNIPFDPIKLIDITPFLKT